jgi:hypothetical protein
MRGFFLAVFAATLLGCGDSPPVGETAEPPISQTAEARQPPTIQQTENHAQTTDTAVQQVAHLPAAGLSPDLRYLPGDAFAVVIFHARRAFESAALAGLPYDELMGPALEAWSFDPREVEHWLLFFTPAVEGEALAAPYSPGAVMRFVNPVDGRKLIATRGEVREVKAGHLTYYVQTTEQPMAFFLPDERTIVFAAQKQLEKMLSPSASPNPLAGHITALRHDRDFHLLVHAERLVAAIGPQLHSPDQPLSPMIAPYIRALDDVSMIAASADLSGEQFFSVEIAARDPQAASRLQKLARESTPIVGAAYSTFRAAVVQAWRGEAAQAVLDVTDSIMARAAVEAPASGIRLTVAKPARLDDLGRRIRSAMASGTHPAIGEKGITR